MHPFPNTKEVGRAWLLGFESRLPLQHFFVRAGMLRQLGESDRPGLLSLR